MQTFSLPNLWISKENEAAHEDVKQTQNSISAE